MKIFLNLFAIFVLMVGFMACGNLKSSTKKQNETSVNEVVRGESGGEGFGRCLIRGCYCKKFEGRGQTCRNCGHAYKKHY